MGQSSKRFASQGANWSFYDENFRSIRQTKLMLSHGLGLISFVPSLAPSQEKVNNRGHFIFLLVVSSGDCMPWMLLQTPVFLVWEQPPIFQTPTSLQTACWTQGPKHLLPSRALPTAPFPTEALPTPVKVRNLAAYLSDYPEKFCYHLLCGLLNGFRLHYYVPVESSFSNNLFSACEYPDRVHQKLIRQIQAGPF